ncbi:MAG: ABC transporter permease subunit [Eubacteriales bacterium]|nr:ABC transporter permease subunit [Eubacteriales bacterium]
MLKYEWKKIWKNRLTQLAVAGCCLFLLFCVYSSIRQITAYNQNGQLLSGMSAVAVMKETQPEITLNQGTVDRLVGQYLAYTADPASSSNNESYQNLSEELYRTYYLPNRDLLVFLTSVYKESDSSMKEALEEHSGNDFLQARQDRDIAAIASLESRGLLTAKEADYWEAQSEHFAEPTVGYHKGWSMILDTLSWMILIMMIVCIGTAPVFAGEYQSKCDSLLLCMKYGKNKLVLAKVLAVWLYATVVYWGITLLSSAIYLGLLGTEGRNLPIQIKYPAVPVGYDLTMGEAVLVVLVMGYVLTLGVMGLTLFLSAVFPHAYGVIICSFLFLVVPLFLSTESGGYGWSRFLSLLPEKIADFSFSSYTAYSLGNGVLNWLEAAILVNGIAAVGFSAAGYAVFRNHKVNK